MTSEDLDATLIDDSCFADFFTMQSQFLDDFEFGLEANNIDSLLELFEEREKRNTNTTDPTLNYLTLSKTNINCNNNVIKANPEVDVKGKSDNIIIISSPKVRKSTTSRPSDVSKSKGTSLLAKPKKNATKRSLLSINGKDFDPFSSYLLQEHDYCLITNDNNRLYNKLPDYITELSNIPKDNNNLNICPQNETFDKIPDYIKDFLNLNENINENEENFVSKEDENILIEFNEAYIEVSDVFFDNEFNSIDKIDAEVYNAEDFNSNSTSDSSNYSSMTSSEESKDIKQMNNILNDNQFLRERHGSLGSEQKDYKNSNNYKLKDKRPSDQSSRSRSCEPRNKIFVNNNNRRRRISTRSSVDGSSDSGSSRSSSCFSCSSCDSYSDRSCDESTTNYKSNNNSIKRNDCNERQFRRKRSLNESYCQKTYRSKSRPNFELKSRNENINNVKSRRNSLSLCNKKDIEQRKIIYVGKIPDGTTKTDVRHWFGRFGSIKEVSIHFRDFGDNYAFVTFYRRSDAFEAIEHANEDSRHPKFDLSFGGRRQFCKTRYEDLDYVEDNSAFNSDGMDFDSLLRSTKAKINR